MEESEIIAMHALEAIQAEIPMSDGAAKEMLRDIQIFSLILKYSFAEYSGFTVAEIASRIQYFKGIRPDPDDPEGFLDQMVDASDPEANIPGSGKSIYDNFVVIQDMITDQLYFVQLDVNLRELSPEVLCGRSLNYIASIILRQRGLPFGMSRDYKGLKPIKALWILPLSRRLGVWEGEFRTGWSGCPDDYITELNGLVENMIEWKVVFLNHGWHNSDEEIIQVLGHLFDTETEETIEYLKKEGIKMTRQIPGVVQEYYKKYGRPFVTLSDEANENYILMKQEVVRKDEEIKSMNEKIALLEAELAKLKGSR